MFKLPICKQNYACYNHTELVDVALSLQETNADLLASGSGSGSYYRVSRLMYKRSTNLATSIVYNSAV